MEQIKKLYDWLDNRTGIRDHIRETLFENVPGGSRWRYVWGSTLTFALMIQFITGIFLWMGYSPSGQTAWESVYYINNHMTCLLYTSPSPRDGLLSRMPSSA